MALDHATQPVFCLQVFCCALHKYCAKEVFLTIHFTRKAGKRKKTGRVSCCLRVERGGKMKRLMAETESEMQRGGCGTEVGIETFLLSSMLTLMIHKTMESK